MNATLKHRARITQSVPILLGATNVRVNLAGWDKTVMSVTIDEFKLLKEYTKPVMLC